MTGINQNQPKFRKHVEHTPNGGTIYRCGEFTLLTRLGLDFWTTDPLCQEWEVTDTICDKRLLPHPDLPVYNNFNRPGFFVDPNCYPRWYPSWWTPTEAVKLYGLRLADADPSLARATLDDPITVAQTNRLDQYYVEIKNADLAEAI